MMRSTEPLDSEPEIRVVAFVVVGFNPLSAVDLLRLQAADRAGTNDKAASPDCIFDRIPGFEAARMESAVASSVLAASLWISGGPDGNRRPMAFCAGHCSSSPGRRPGASHVSPHLVQYHAAGTSTSPSSHAREAPQHRLFAVRLAPTAGPLEDSGVGWLAGISRISRTLRPAGVGAGWRVGWSLQRHLCRCQGESSPLTNLWRCAILNGMAKITPSEDEFMVCLRADLRASRAASGVSNASLAVTLHVSPSTVSGWLTGSGEPPRISQLYSLTVAMGADLEMIIRRSTEMAVAHAK